MRLNFVYATMQGLDPAYGVYVLGILFVVCVSQYMCVDMCGGNLFRNQPGIAVNTQTLTLVHTESHTNGPSSMLKGLII